MKNLSQLGSLTAKNGFKNEDEIRDKFNNWKNDKESILWLRLWDIKKMKLKK